MLSFGLVSKTFDHKKPEEVIKIVKDAELDSIEWSGAKHVPPGDFRQAIEVAKLTKEAGLKVAAYGSYFYVGQNKIKDFLVILKTAKQLQAPTIRVWANNTSSSKTDKHQWTSIVNEARCIAVLAEKESVAVAFEYHSNTLTDTNETALKLISNINHHNCFLYWQPLLQLDIEERIDGLRKILPWLKNVHVFHWTIDPDSGKRIRNPLEKGLNEWQEYIKILNKSPKEHYLLLEFVVNDSILQLLEDSAVLRSFKL